MRRLSILLAAGLLLAQSERSLSEPAALQGKPWARHTVDNTSRGADGVKLLDATSDGRPDVVAGWEQGGVVRVYYNPSRVDSRTPWPQVTVGRVASVEDAVFADLDRDLAYDVVSACEGKTRSLFVHWAPKDSDRYFDESSWKTEAFPAAAGLMMWMYAVPMEVDGRNGPDLVAAGKGPGAAIGWLEAPPNPRDVAAWKWHALRDVGWTMSIYTVDMDGDRDLDILFSDRKGARSGVYWIENPGSAGGLQAKPWTEHPIGAPGREVMFLDYADADGDGAMDVIAAVKPREVHVMKRLDKQGRNWRNRAIMIPAVTGTAKSVRVTDVDADGRMDLVYSAEQTKAGQSGVIWMPLDGGAVRDISGPVGEKYDILELIDLDGDQDLDVLTTEENHGLGVIWYENPGR